ncbi:MAG: sodium/solute symporter [Planctomycetia bacterium]|nr:sodium/solute symporter [Planctomycetia bacterium]
MISFYSPLLALHVLDYAVVVGYLVGMLWLGAYFSRTQNTSDEYFLASRRIPWFAIGLSIIATLMSSLTYVSEPGEVWKSGITNMLGKMLAIPFEMALVWLVLIPFLTKLRYTSAYEYLGDRFGAATKWLGIVLFMWLAISWMGFIVLVSSRILAVASGLNLMLVVAVVGVVATLYTVAGGLRAVIWTDVVQVVLMLGGALMTLIYVAVQTSSTPADWYALVVQRHATKQLEWFSVDPFTRSTILTVAASMFVWHVCTHVSNQMTVQRYFSAGSLTAARRSFVVGSLTGVSINLLLLVVGLALYFYYYPQARPEGVLPTGKEADMIFPLFALRRLPAGLAGAWLAAMLAAAMSSIDSGINSASSVLSVEWNRAHPDRAPDSEKSLAGVKLSTLLLGLFVTAAAYGLDVLTRDRNIIDMMGRSFNCFTGPLGGLFFLGIFVKRCGNAGATTAGLVGLAVSIGLAFGQELFGLAQSPSFTWVQPCSLAATLVVGTVSSILRPRREGGGAADG